MSSNKFEALVISDDSDDDANIGESGKIAGKTHTYELGARISIF
jgi:hypothetical protein